MGFLHPDAYSPQPDVRAAGSWTSTLKNTSWSVLQVISNISQLCWRTCVTGIAPVQRRSAEDVSRCAQVIAHHIRDFDLKSMEYALFGLCMRECVQERRVS